MFHHWRCGDIIVNYETKLLLVLIVLPLVGLMERFRAVDQLLRVPCRPRYSHI